MQKLATTARLCSWIANTLIAVALLHSRRKKMLAKFWSDDSGQDVPEYALMLALILVLTISVIAAIGSNSDTIFGQVRDAMASAVAG